MPVTHNITLKANKSTSLVHPRVVVRTGDVDTQVISAQITNDGKEYSSPLQSARLDILHEDGTWARCSASKSGSKVECTLPSEATSSPGRCRLAHFVFYSDGKVESTEGFELVILPNVDVSDADREAENYDDQLQALYDKWLAFEQQSESDFEQAQADRQSAYEAAESSRDSSYATAEASRDSAQAANDAAQAKNNSDQAANNAAAQGLVAVILSAGEYDPDTLEPTVEGAVGKMYLVPMPQAQAVAAAIPVRFSLTSQEDGSFVATQSEAADGDVYVEWLWINSAWERIGLSTATIDPITTDQIDAVCSDSAPQGKQVLNLTGLSYLWAKVKSWAAGAFAALSHTHAAGDVTSGTLAADRLPVVPVAKGGTGATSASAALTALGAASESDLDDVRDSLSQTPRVVMLKSDMTRLSAGDSVSVSGLSEYSYALLMGYTDASGLRSSVLTTTAGANAAFPCANGVQGVNVSGGTLKALDGNSEAVTVYRVYGVSMP